MADQINVADYLFDESEITIKRRPKQKKYRMKHKGRFMCMAEPWAVKAFEVARQKQSPGPVIVGLILWQQFWFQFGEQPLKFTNSMLDRFGLGRHFFSKWLPVLEQHGLITTQKFKHRSPLITLKNISDQKE